MSNSILPHLLSDTPPPLVADDEDIEDEFGDFEGPGELSFDNEIPSTPPSFKNSKDYFPEPYSNFNNLSDGEKKYELNDTSQNKSTSFISSIPSDNYFSLWDKIEDNIPEIIDEHEHIEDSKEHIKDIGKPKNQVIDNSIENSICIDNNIHDNEVSTKSIEESSEIANLFHLDSTNNIDENDDNQVIEILCDVSLKNNTDKESQAENDIEIAECNFESTEKKQQSLFEAEVENHSTLKNYGESENVIQADNSQLPQSDSIDIKTNFVDVDNVINSNAIDKTSAIHSWTTLGNQEDEDDFGEFADFNSYSLKNSIPNPERLGTDDTEENDFDEFGSYQNTSISKNDFSELPNQSKENQELPQEKNSEESSDFDDFTSYSANDPDSNMENKREDTLDKVLKICKTAEEALKESQIVLEKMFTVNKCTTAEYSNCDYVLNNSVFENLKDITETNALTYQWGKSMAQKNILKTLNIDIRNILYGPTWNSGVPIFAANLCSKPLEPVKSELPTPSSPQKNIELQEPTVPEFDWNGSGLTNLQDSLENVTNEEPKKVQDSPNLNPEVLLPSYADAVLPTPSKINDFADDLNQFEEIDKVENFKKENDEFSEFASYQAAEEKQTKWNKMLPLRESHISNRSHQDSLETDKISLYFQELTMGKTETTRFVQNSSFELPQNQQLPVKSTLVFDDKPVINSKPVKLKDNSVHNIELHSEKNESDHLENSNKLEGKYVIEENQNTNKNHEDEFTDFQSSLPCPSKPSIDIVLLEPQTPPVVLEPLKPAILQPELVKNPLKIEWPEPGLDEVEINRIVNGVLRKNSTSENMNDKMDTMKIPEHNTKQPLQNNDQDDWSDFISVKEPLKSRTSTPDLPLSVFNLSNIQPSKISAPYVAPNGVVHSPAKTSTLSFPVINRNTQNVQQHFHQQPFITSQAFSALYSNTKSNVLLPSKTSSSVSVKQTNTQFLNNDFSNMDANYPSKNYGVNFVQNGVQHNMPSSHINSSMEDDDWGEFVSAPNTISQSKSSFFPSSSYLKTNFGFSDKSASVQTFSTSKKTIVKQEKNNTSIISTMPDLDFVTPKSRNSMK